MHPASAWIARVSRGAKPLIVRNSGILDGIGKAATMGDNDKRTGGIFEADKASLIFAKKHELPLAMPPCAGFAPQNPYGWVSGAMPAPGKDEKYIVEFLGKTTYRVIAYFDKFARVFAVDQPITYPPAQTPDLTVSHYPEQSGKACQRGCIEVLDPNGEMRLVAEYRFERGRYFIEGSWFDFGPFSENLTYEDFIARIYLAFVYRPALCATQPPLYGIDNVDEALRKSKPLDAMNRIVEVVAGADADAALTAPGLERCLVRWLAEAGLGTERAVELSRMAKGDPLRLIRTKRYADTYYLGTSDDEAAAPYRRMVWALEGALNRYLLSAESLGAKANTAHEAEAGQWDYYLIESIARQMPLAEAPADAQGARAGEWSVRLGIAEAIERLRLPFRFTTDFRTNAAGGMAAFDAVVPDVSLMPATRWPQGAAGWVEVSAPEREAQAVRYAMRVAIILAAIAFSQSRAIDSVRVAVRTVSDGLEAGGGSGEFPQDEPPRLFSVEFERSAFCANGAYRRAGEGDPAPFFAWLGVTVGQPGIESPFEDERLANPLRGMQPEIVDQPVPESARAALGANELSDLAVNYNAKRRSIGERLADSIAKASTTTERVRIVTAMRGESDDPDIQDACTDLMVALTADEVDPNDQNAVVNKFLGEDELMAAIMQSRSIAEKGELDEAVMVLAAAIGKADLSDRFADVPDTVFRCFESYASRVVYNRGRLAGLFGQDADRQVKLAPDSLYFCCLEAVKLLEHSFDRTEEALGYGRRCIGLAPMGGPGYLQMARTYMLVGDMDNTVATINRYLETAFLPNEIAMGYYQLAYAEWKAGRLQTGVAGYLKSMTTSPIVYEQARLELEELLNDPGAKLLSPDEVDEVLAENRIVVAPTETVLDWLLEASAAAVDAELFVIARSTLAAYCQHRPDDAIVNVFRSLGD